MSEVLVSLSGVSKRFKLYRSVGGRLADWLHVPGGPRRQDFYALRDLSCSISRGECLGVIGPNGAGKSTLLKLLTRVLEPTAGSIEINGRVLSLLELGTGFNPDLTGRQNVEQSARLLGFPRGYALERLDTIRAFAEIGDYFDRPVKFYSSGMLVRLAFALFSTMQPELFLVDEALAVGDLHFAGRALGRVRSMVDDGTTLVFVSHDLRLINELCTRAIWLHAGTLQMDGEPRDVTRAYQQFVVRGSYEQRTSAVEPSCEESRLALGRGWYPLEAYAGEIFRWASDEAQIVVEDTDPRDLLLELDAGSAEQRVELDALDADGQLLTTFNLSGRRLVSLPVPRTEFRRQILLRANGHATTSSDGRTLAFRLLRWGRSNQRTLFDVADASDWAPPEHDLDLNSELAAMRYGLQRSPISSPGTCRVSHVSTRSAPGVEAVRFASHEPLTLEIGLTAERAGRAPTVEVQLRDAFDRLLWTTRSSWHLASQAALQAGERVTLAFSTANLRLGRGLYQVSVALLDPTDERMATQRIGSVWKFEVVEDTHAAFKGIFDLGWQHAVTSIQDTTAAGAV